MRGSKRILCILILLITGVSGATGFGANAQDSATQHYVVQYGDTLWDIAGTYLGSPYRWREIHNDNPFITNPNLIYPGDVLGISTGDLGAEAAEAEETTGIRRSGKNIARPWYGIPAPSPEEVPKTAKRYPVVPSTEFIEAIGHIAPYTMKELEAAQFGQISGVKYAEGEERAQLIDSESGRPGLIFGDIIYINRGTAQNVREGDVFLAFRPFREIRHPLTDEVLGTQISILGRLRIKTLEPNVSCAEIIKSYNYMEIGNPIMPVSELSLPLKKLELGNSRSYGFKVGNQLIAHVVAEKVGHRLMSDGDIVFLDVGAAQGVQPADNFIVFREVGEGYPKQAIGRITVLSVQEQSSTALVTESVKSIELGEKIVLMR